jgi:hypothetical protein
MYINNKQPPQRSISISSCGKEDVLKKLFFILVIVLAGGLVHVSAEEDGENGGQFELKGSISLGSSIATQYLSVHPAFVWKPSFFGLGIGVKNFLGLNYADIYMAPYARIELSWFYLGGGASLSVKGPYDPTGIVIDVPTVSLFATTGLAVPIIPLGPGKLGLDISLDFFISSIEVDDPDSIEEALFVTPFAVGLATILTMPKLTAGVHYVVSL